MEIKSKISNNIVYKFPYDSLFQILNYLYRTRNNVINLTGPIQIGKTLLTKKILFYLHER